MCVCVCVCVCVTVCVCVCAVFPKKICGIVSFITKRPFFYFGAEFFCFGEDSRLKMKKWCAVNESGSQKNCDYFFYGV